jgi:hypothetical protein
VAAVAFDRDHVMNDVTEFLSALALSIVGRRWLV